MRVVKLGPSYTTRDLAIHLVKLADTRGLPVPEDSVIPLTRGYSRLIRGFGKHPCLLILITESLLKGGYVEEVGLGDRILSPHVFDVELKEMGGRAQPWRHLYFKRFPETWHEVEYYSYWLGVLIDAEMAPAGSVPRLGEQEFGSWNAVRELAIRKLEKAITVIEGRLVTRSSLLEWPVLPEPNRAGDGTLVDLLGLKNSWIIPT